MKKTFKRIALFTMVFALVFSLGIPALAEDDPYSDYISISQASDFAKMRDDLGGNYRLDADIILTEEWTSIGNDSEPFTGKFVSSGDYTITVTEVPSANTYAGFFYTVSDAVIDGIKLDLTAVEATSNGIAYGGFVGTAKGNTEIINCSVIGGKYECGDYMGGFVGLVADNATIKNCTASDIEITGSAQYNGGFAGYISLNAIVEDCSATNIKVYNSTYGGGFVGRIHGCTVILNCVAENVELTGTGTSYVGGFAGSIYETALIIGCKANDVSIEGAVYSVGGFAGEAQSASTRDIDIRDCHVNTFTSVDTGEYVGGFIGNAAYCVKITDSSVENIDIACSGLGGGFIGNAENSLVYNELSATNCYAINGKLTTTGTAVGGFVGRISGGTRIENSYAQIDIHGGSSSYSLGGFAGDVFNGSNSEIKNCYSNGSVSSEITTDDEEKMVGSFVGNIPDSTIENCYSTGTVLTPNSKGGGFAGRVGGSAKISGCLYDTTTTRAANEVGAGSDDGIVGLSTTDMISAAKFISWSVVDNAGGNATGSDNEPWLIDDGITYPYFYYQYDGQDSAEYTIAATYSEGTALEKYADFEIDGRTTPFEAKSIDAAKAYFPYNGTSMYVVNKDTSSSVPEDGFVADSGLYSLGGVSATGIISFTKTYTVTYNANTGTGSDHVVDSLVTGDIHKVLTLSDTGISKNGYTLKGWNALADGSGDSYAVGANLTVPAEDVTLYAIWEANAVTPPPSVVEPDGPFTSEHYGYIVGYSDGTVRPEQNITRAEVTTVFFRMITDELRAENWTQGNDFSDVKAGSWYNNAISVMEEMGVVNGYSDGTFKPNNSITRAEMAKIAAVFAELTGDPVVSDILFNDIDGHWAEEYIETAASIGWIQGYSDGSFRPNQNITRAEFMAMVNRMLKRAPQNASDLLEGMIEWSDNANTSAWYYLDVQEATNSHDCKDKDQLVPSGAFYYEKWTQLQEIRDWSALEKEWATPNP